MTLPLQSVLPSRPRPARRHIGTAPSRIRADGPSIRTDGRSIRTSQEPQTISGQHLKSKDDYIPRDEEGKAALFDRFRDTIAAHAASVGVTAPDMTAQAADATWFRYTLNRMLSMRDCAAQWTEYKNNLLGGTGAATPPVTPPPADPEPEPLAPGVLTRFRELVRRIKTSPGHTDAIGAALGIIGAESTSPDPATLAPDISLRTSGGQVEIVWNKGKQEAVEIQKDTGSGWRFLAIDTRPNYIDTTPFPSPAAMWKYRAIYTDDSQRVGQWSNVAEISVGG